MAQGSPLGVLLLLLAGWVAHATAQTPTASTPAVHLTAAEIMARVAANQDRSEVLRSQYLYSQHIHVVSRKTNRHLMREETANYQVSPEPGGFKRTLTQLTGKCLSKGKYLTYAGEPIPEPETLDASLVRSFREDLTDDKSKDGLGRDLFPLTTEEQKKYEFKLQDEQTVNNRSVYHLTFAPKQKSDGDWAGDAFIDREDFEPVAVSTKLAQRIPFVARTLLGTDLPGLGFSVTYQRQPDGVWFPATFGTEFRLHALFFINRDISLSLENSQFEHTHVDSKMTYLGPIQ
ncbi:MAG: hypothetical protein ACR2JE_04030 [Acidobacteriaceae bacterium]